MVVPSPSATLPVLLSAILPITPSISMMRLKQVRASISSFPLRMQNSYAAIPSSRSLATRYSCCRSPLTLLQWPHNSWRFSM